MTVDRMHDRLPWYVNGTLDADESVMFQRHLDSCPACQKELRVLEALRDELEKHGEDLLGDHPPPEQLAALIEPADEPLTEEQSAGVRRHLAICATCAEESSWLRGEAIADLGSGAPDLARPVSGAPSAREAEAPRAPTRAARRPMAVLPAVAVALAAVAIVLVVRTPRSQPHPRSEVVVQSQLILPTQRTEGRTTVHVRSDATTIRVHLEIDFDAASFPLALEILGAKDEVVLRRDGIAADEVTGGRFLFLDLPRDQFPDGDYIVRLRSAANGAEPPAEYPMRLISDLRP